jgi:aldehyde dehydrogenase (NAD+)
MKEANPTDIRAAFDRLEANEYPFGSTTAAERKKLLKSLSSSVMKHKTAIREALWKDYRKPAAEVDLTEIYVITSEVKHAVSHLTKWMSPQSVSTPLALMGSSSNIRYEPKGVSLIIAPWNYPLQLAFGPLISAIAAGCPVILKPSENAPHIAKVMGKIISDVFKDNQVVMLEGAVETATELLKLPFRHIFFTGAPAVGKVVMKAAAEHLTSVTLELGGKSPTIIDETANLNSAAKRLAWGKFSNNGQICIAPDYVLVHEKVKAKFQEKLLAQLKVYYGEDPSQSPDYMRIINNNHYQRVTGYLDDAVAKGAKVVVGGRRDSEQNYLEPTVVTDVDMKSDVMQKEIFGPILPIISYKDIDQCINIIKSKEKPLALYIYSSSNRNINRLLKETRAGGTCINNNAVHFFNNNLPFGGSNNSGLGKGHGWFGFAEFSNARGVMRQHLPGALEMLMPPYNGFKQKLIDLTIKWF